MTEERGKTPPTLFKDLVTFMKQPSLIIFQARRAVFRESSSPEEIPNTEFSSVSVKKYSRNKTDKQRTCC